MKRAAPRPVSIVVVVVGVLITLALAWVVNVVDNRSNNRLLDQQVSQVAAALTSEVPVIQSELTDAAEIAVATDADPASFKNFASTHLSSGGLDSLSLWRIHDGTADQLVFSGQAPTLASDGRARAFFASVQPGSAMSVTSLLAGAGNPPRLGFAVMPASDTSGYAVYAELGLPAGRRVSVSSASPYNDLNFALYLGARQVDSQLLEATAPLPFKGHTSAVIVPFGNTTVTLVGTATGQLAGGLSAALPWIVLGVGCALALAGGSTVEYVARRRSYAEGLARENERLYLQQRDIAAVLQHALLPALPEVEGIDVAARYAAGVAGIDVGGDWYEVIRTQAGRCVFVVGDVSGRGLNAATTMAALRHAIRAYVVQGDDVETVLTKINSLLSFDDDYRFATVVIGDVDVVNHRVTLASAGHFLPLLVTDDATDFVRGHVEPPIGIGPSRPQAVSFDVPEKATLLAFTDGLVERKGEIIDVGLERLRVAAFDNSGTVDQLLDTLMSSLVVDEVEDDAVILGIRWQR